jgi:intracellular septation protein
MKILFDFFPIFLFFLAFKVWGVYVAADEAIYVATGVAIAATILQIGYLKLRRRKVDTMMWVSLAIIVVFGGATIALHDETFIKWKPTVLYWLFAVILSVSELFWRKNLIRSLMQAQQISMPDAAWRTLVWSWVGFFSFMGVLNLYIAFNYTTDTWVSFKLFGGMGLMLVFVILQALYMARYIDEKKLPEEQK